MTDILFVIVKNTCLVYLNSKRAKDIYAGCSGPQSIEDARDIQISAERFGMAVKVLA